jgi:hypothetical protein
LVLHASARRHSVQSYAGPLSIKTVLRGRVSWVVGGRELVVCPRSFLVLFSERPGKGYSLADRFSMQIMRREGLTDILTSDKHFEQEGFRPLLRSTA